MNHLIVFFFYPFLLAWSLIEKKPQESTVALNNTSILVVAVGGIGDTILSIPTIKALRKNFPTLSISLWVNTPEIGELFQEKGMVDSRIYYPVHRFFNPVPFFFENIKFLLNIRKMGITNILIAEPSQNIVTALIGFFSGAKIRVGPRYRLGKADDTNFLLTHSLPFSNDKHVVDMNLALLKFFGIENTDPDLSLSLPEEAIRKADFLMEKYSLSRSPLLIGMHIGANPNQLYKCWEPAKFAKISDFLFEEYNAIVVLVGGNGEKPIVDKMLGCASHKLVNLVGDLNIMETAAFIARCHLFITNDSGPMHVAALVKTPVVAIFGPTRPKKNAPYGRHVVIRKEMDCSPCYDWRFSRIKDCGHLSCIRDISVGDVKSAIYALSDHIEGLWKKGEFKNVFEDTGK